MGNGVYLLQRNDEQFPLAFTTQIGHLKEFKGETTWLWLPKTNGKRPETTNNKNEAVIKSTKV